MVNHIYGRRSDSRTPEAMAKMIIAQGPTRSEIHMEAIERGVESAPGTGVVLEADAFRRRLRDRRNARSTKAFGKEAAAVNRDVGKGNKG